MILTAAVSVRALSARVYVDDADQRRGEGDSRTMWQIPEIIFIRKGPPSKFVLWKTVVTGTIVAVILFAALIGNNRMVGNMYKRSMNIVLVAALMIDLWAVWRAAKQLRALRQRGD